MLSDLASVHPEILAPLQRRTMSWSNDGLDPICEIPPMHGAIIECVQTGLCEVVRTKGPKSRNTGPFSVPNPGCRNLRRRPKGPFGRGGRNCKLALRQSRTAEAKSPPRRCLSKSVQKRFLPASRMSLPNWHPSTKGRNVVGGREGEDASGCCQGLDSHRFGTWNGR